MNELLKNNIIAVDLPDWLTTKFYFEWGVIADNFTYDDFCSRTTQDLSKQHILIYESQLRGIFEDKEKWHRFIEYLKQSQVHSMIFYIRDLYLSVHPELLRDLNKLGNGRKFRVLSNCYHMDDYENLTFHVLNEEEHYSSNPVMQSLAFELARIKKQPKKDFLLITVLKDDFRKRVHKHLTESGALRNSIVKTSPSGEGIPTHSQLIEALSKQTKDQHFTRTVAYMTDNGPPNYKFYEEVFCEIVLESKNFGISDLSEKTFRPVLLGIPIVFLGSKVMYEKLIHDGYKLVDNNEFYTKWHSDSNFDDRLDALVEFVEDIKNNEMLKKEMLNSAEHNFKVFWTERPLKNRKINLNIIHECFGENNLISQIYKRFNS